MSNSATSEDEGPGCMPAMLALAVLMGIAGFITCGFMTWFIYQQRDQLALRTLRGNFIPAVEQSFLEPDEKTRTVQLLTEFADELERGKVEGWQAAGVMQRLTRLPILQWGQIRRMEQYVDSRPESFTDDDSLQFDRLRKGVEKDTVTAIDFVHVLSPVLQPAPDQLEAPLVERLDDESVRDVVQRARLVADRGEVDSNPISDIGIDILVRRQIEIGMKEGTY